MRENRKKMRQSAPIKKSVETSNTERKYNLFISPIPLSKKPETDEEKTLIHHNFIATGITYNQLVTNSTHPKSYTIAPAMFNKNYRNRENWASQSVYMLDFDNTITVDQVLDRFKEYGITPNYYYHTFSHTPEKPRFRVVLLTDYENFDRDDCFKILNGLHKVFPEADKKALHPESFLFGGKDCHPITDEPVPFSKLEQMISLFVLDSDDGKTRGIISEEIYDQINDEDRKSVQATEYQVYLEKLRRLKNNTFDFEELYNKVRIFRDFIDGEWLYHSQLFGIASSLIWLKGGAKLFNDTMEQHNLAQRTFYGKEKFKIMSYLKKREYFPYTLKHFSPYQEDHKYCNLITAVRFSSGAVEVIKPQEFISLEEGEQIFKRETERIFESTDKNIFIFKVPTGFGKTTFLTKQQGQYIAFPTHTLKDEIGKKMEVPHYVIPQLPTFSSADLNTELSCYYNMGLNEAARLTMTSVASGQHHKYLNVSDQKLAKDYLNGISMEPETGTTILTTHQRALLTDVPNSIVIFDEDPIKDILSISSVNLDDLILLNAKLPKQYRFAEQLEELSTVAPGIVVPIKIAEIPRDILLKILLGNNVKTNVVKFFKASGYIKNEKDPKMISYVTHHVLPQNKKIIIMSATAQVDLYEKLYPGRVEVIDISNIENVGKVYQHTEQSLSRVSLTESSSIDINEEIGYIPAITFKAKKKWFGQIPLMMHFFNVQGFDELRGQDIAVIGTPHYNEIVYRLVAFSIGLNPNNEGKLKTRIVEHGNYRFKFKTFEQKEMQEIQLNLIESELIQAVGRARVLREDCVVELYSNLPLAMAIIDNVRHSF